MNYSQSQFNHPLFGNNKMSLREQVKYWHDQWERLAREHDDVLILLDRVLLHFTEEHPLEWATLPLSVQTKIAAVLGDIDEDEVVWEEGE